MRLRNAVPWAFLVLLLAGLAGVAWVTQQPAHPWTERLAAWPWVGPLVERLRQPYLLPAAGTPAAGEMAAGEEASAAAPGGGRPRHELAPGPVIHSSSPETMWVRPGTPLYAVPSPRAAVVGVTDHYTALPVLSRRPAAPEEGEDRPAEWLWVRFDGREGWVRWVEPPPGEPPLGRDPRPVTPVPALTPDAKRLALARELLGPGHTTGAVGPYLLVTDVADPALLERLATVAAGIEPVYRRRYGLGLVGEPAEAVLLFGREEDYRIFQRAERMLEGLPSAGHAGHGLVALYQENRSWEELSATFVHELTHLLNRRALGPVLPPWLDEGVAEDLAWSRLDEAGRLQPGTFGGLREIDERTVRTTGGLAVLSTLDRLAESMDQGFAPSLEELVRLDWEAFVRTDRQLHYRQSGLLMRFLLDGSGGEPAAGFRRFLGETAAGEPIGAERLAAVLGLPWPEIEARYRRWLDELDAQEPGTPEPSPKR